MTRIQKHEALVLFGVAAAVSLAVGAYLFCVAFWGCQ